MRSLLLTRPFALGTFVTMTDPTVVELIALAGFDFVIVECEHAGLDFETVRKHLTSCRACGLGVLVRVPQDDPGFIQRVLDMGSEGVLIPHVGTAEAARRAAAAVRYPPVGHRGMAGAVRASNYGAHGLSGNRALADELNRTSVVAVMIEDATAVADIEEIVRVPGIDLIEIGPSDLAASMGLLEQPDHPDLAAAITRIMHASNQVGIKVGMPIQHSAYPRSFIELREDGVWLLTEANDASYLLRAMKDSRQRLAGAMD